MGIFNDWGRGWTVEGEGRVVEGKAEGYGWRYQELVQTVEKFRGGGAVRRVSVLDHNLYDIVVLLLGADCEILDRRGIPESGRCFLDDIVD